MSNPFINTSVVLNLGEVTSQIWRVFNESGLNPDMAPAIKLACEVIETYRSEESNDS